MVKLQKRFIVVQASLSRKKTELKKFSVAQNLKLFLILAKKIKIENNILNENNELLKNIF